MSWEDISTDTRPCPCGTGVYTVTHRSDDWGRTEAQWEMHCPSCKGQYELYTYHQTRKGMTETYHKWVPNPLMRELADLHKRIEEEKHQLATYVETEYSNTWHQYFSNKSKKAIWRELTEDGRQYPSLSTFYSHVRHSGLSRVLDGYFHFHNIQTVINLLGLEDEQLDTKIKCIEQLEQQQELQTQHIRHKAAT